MTYSEKLRDPRWQKKRLEIFQRDGFACLSCNATEKPLVVHHVIYRKIEPWAYPDYLYQTQCEPCHHERQALTDKIVESLRISLMNVPTERLEAVAARICSEAMSEIALGTPNNTVKSHPVQTHTHTQKSMTVTDSQ